MSRLDLKIFLSSPGDVSDERGLARTVLDRLSQEYALRNRIHIEEVSWDDPGAPVPMDAHLTPQQAIDNRRPKPSQCDVVVVMLWSRMGTPLHTASRRAFGARAVVSGTEYEFCDAMGAAKQTGKPTVLVYRRTEEPRIGLGDRDLDEKHRQYKGVEAFFAQFTNTDGSLRQSFTSYDSPSEFADRLERGLRELIQVQLDALPKDAPAKGSSDPITRDPTPAWEGNPYLGLNAFREKHAVIFFGRGRETDELIKRFATPTTRIVAVIGASGSGKSSLVGAGLIPRLHGGAFAGSADWLAIRFSPAEHGSDPFFSLVRALPLKQRTASESPEAIAKTLFEDPTELSRLADRLLHAKPSHAKLLLFADQFEELFTARVDTRYREPFIKLIARIGQEPSRLRLVLTLRADYYEHCTRNEQLAALLGEASFPLSAPNTHALTEMIERPARIAGLKLGDGLAGAILDDVGAEPGALALVEFALAELYERGGGESMTAEAYRALGRQDGANGNPGGIGGVIDRQAEQAVQDDQGRVDNSTLSKIFPVLADVDEKGGAVRKRAKLDDFVGPERALVDRLVNGRLLVTNREEGAAAWVEVAHEAVLRDWQRFQTWLKNNQAFLLWRRRLKVWADAGSVLRDAPLAEAQGWYEKRPADLNDSESAFISRSLKAGRRRRQQRISAVVIAFLGVVSFAAWQYPKAVAERERQRPLYNEADWVVIAPGEFLMGSDTTDTESFDFERTADKKQHRVRIAAAFKLSKYEVTFEEYDHFAYATNRRPPSDGGLGSEFTETEKKRLPVINVSWEDARAYAAWLSEKTGKKLRLPTEAEWEYAARAGTTTRRYWGDAAEEACQHANVFDRNHEA